MSERTLGGEAAPVSQGTLGGEAARNSGDGSRETLLWAQRLPLGL